MLSAWSNLPDVPLKVVGPLLPGTAEIRHSRSSGAIEFLGSLPHERVLDLMRSARFIVVPSVWYEAMPMTILEAFATGAPVIASDLGSLPELVEDGRTGLLVAPNDAIELATKARWAWEHPAEMRRMGELARNAYEAKHTGQHHLAGLRNVYAAAQETRKAATEVDR